MTVKFLKAIIHTPVFNIPNIDYVFGNNEKEKFIQDHLGHTRELEFVAFKNTIFKNIKYLKQYNAYQVETIIYPSKSPIYIDARFVKPLYIEKEENKIKQTIFNEKEILEKLNKSIGLPYLWGGNLIKGIPELLKFYPPKKKSLQENLKWILKGHDCSGLLFYATNGKTPRNTSHLMHFGNSLDIENKSIDQISKKLKPLDLIIYPGHLIIIYDEKNCVESKEKKGVLLTPIKKRINSLFFEGKAPVQTLPNHKNFFIIKRWIKKK